MNYIIAIGAFQALVATVLLGRRGRLSKADSLLVILTLCIGAHLAIKFCIYNFFKDAEVHRQLNTFLGFSYGPLLYLYARKRLDDRFVPFSMWYVFIPTFLGAVAYLTVVSTMWFDLMAGYRALHLYNKGSTYVMIGYTVTFTLLTNRVRRRYPAELVMEKLLLSRLCFVFGLLMVVSLVFAVFDAGRLFADGGYIVRGVVYSLLIMVCLLILQYKMKSVGERPGMEMEATLVMIGKEAALDKGMHERGMSERRMAERSLVEGLLFEIPLSEKRGMPGERGSAERMLEEREPAGREAEEGGQEEAGFEEGMPGRDRVETGLDEKELSEKGLVERGLVVEGMVAEGMVAGREDRRERKQLLSMERQAEIIAVLDKYLRKSRLYREPDISLDMLAREVGLNRHHISEAMNVFANKSFYQYINEYRIEEIRSKMRQMTEKEVPVNVLSLAYGCGFKAKSSFNQHFKKLTGNTPSEYLKLIRMDLQKMQMGG